MLVTRGISYLIVGPPGCGKSRWIRNSAAAAGCILFRWNCRDDRALRQGRELLHGIVRTREPTWVWLEGADDITLDAQAFLRRILETACPHVTCALEIRRIECMAEPIQSRCILKRITSTVYPTHRQQQIRKIWGLPEDHPVPDVATPKNLSELREARLAGADPYKVMVSIAKGTKLEHEALKLSTVGSSPWILSAWILVNTSACEHSKNANSACEHSKKANSACEHSKNANSACEHSKNATNVECKHSACE